MHLPHLLTRSERLVAVGALRFAADYDRDADKRYGLAHSPHPVLASAIAKLAASLTYDADGEPCQCLVCREEG